MSAWGRSTLLTRVTGRHDVHRRPGWRNLPAVAVLLAGILFLAVGSPTASAAPTWTMSVSPAQIPRGGSVAITVTRRARCHVILTIAGSRFHYGIKRKLVLTIPRNEPTGRVRVEMDCGQWYETSSFKIIKSPLAQRTPITVYNVCHLNPGLGHYISTNVSGYPAVIWPDGSHVRMFAYSIDGDTAVDVAVIANAQGGVAYFAYCTWDRWLTVAQFQQAQAQQGVPSAQASSFAYLIQEQQVDAIQQEDSDWFTPSPGWQECPTNPYDYCDYEYTGGY